MFSLNDLNVDQRRAAEETDGPVLILAGAGSGKTRTLVYRIANMVLNKNIPADRILGVSFTNKAASELRERVFNLVGKERSKGITLTTFHSLGVMILKREIKKLGYHRTFSIFDSGDQLSIIKMALKNFKDEKKFDPKKILHKISFLKNNSILDHQFVNSIFFDSENPYDIATEFIYPIYQEKLQFMNAIDFDDILFLSAKLLRENKDIAEKYSRKFQYIMVDEYQDTNSLQFEMVKKLTVLHNNICVVGDDDQSIYAFRGADIENILGFERKFSGCRTIKLLKNYRSSEPILSLANEIIKSNKKRKEKKLKATKKSKIKPLLWAMGDSDHEAQVVVEDILKLKREVSLDSIAILYRSNTQAPLVEEELNLAGIPYRILGGQKFYDKKEIKDIIAYLSVINNPYNELSLRRILNVPNRGIGMATLKRYLDFTEKNRGGLYFALQNYRLDDSKKQKIILDFVSIIERSKEEFQSLGLERALLKLIDRIDYFAYIEKQYDDNIKKADLRKKDLEFFINATAKFEKFIGSKNATLNNYLEKLLLLDSQDSKSEDEEKDQEQEVTLLTLHGAKGLEFENVYIIGMEEEMLPHKKTLEADGDIEEERRLCYVGVTRAKDRLVMTYCKERNLYGKKRPRVLSRFISSINKKELLVEQDRTSFGHMSQDEVTQYKKDFFNNLISSIQ